MQTNNPPHEFKVMRIRECLAPYFADTPEKACEYWRANIPHSDWYDECKEAFVVLVLDTRKRIIGHNLITLGLLDECHAHSREVFRAAIVSAGKEIILIHNLCAATHKLCYVQCGFMCSDGAVGMLIRAAAQARGMAVLPWTHVVLGSMRISPRGGRHA